MDKKKKLILGGIGVVIIGIVVAILLTQCNNNPNPSSSSSENPSSESSSSSSESSSSSSDSSSSSESSSSSQAVKHTVVFQNYDGSIIQSTEVEEGTQIVLPANNPVREDEADLGYVFVGYTGYTPNMVVGSSDLTFVAEFELYSNTIMFIHNASRATFSELDDFSSNRLLIPSAAESDPVTDIAAEAAMNQTTIDTVFIPTSITSIGANAFAGCFSIERVFYLGSSAQWQLIAIASGNEILSNKVLFYSETQIAQGWHYVDEIATVWDSPLYLTTTLDFANAPTLSATTESNAALIVDSFRFNFYQGKSLAGGIAFISSMREGSIASDASTPFGSIIAITMTFDSKSSYFTLNIGASASNLSMSYRPTSGVRLELPTRPSFFNIFVPENMMSMDPFNDGLYLTSMVIEYTNETAPAYPVYALSADKTSYIVTSFSGTPVNFVIPTYYNGLPVTEIGDYAFKNCTSLITIVLPESITKIGNNAFQDCQFLTGLDLPTHLVSIGDYAFYSCYSITYLHFPSSLESMGVFACSTMLALTDITFEDGIKMTTFPSYAFTYCVFTTIRLPEGLLSTGFDMFQSMSSLTTVYLPLSLTNIANQTFCACDNIKDIYYAGTEAQWNTVTKYDDFLHQIGSAVIHFAA